MRVSSGRKIIEKGGSFYVCIPARMRRAMGWNKETRLAFYRNGDNELYISYMNSVVEKQPSFGTQKALTKNLFLSP